MESLRAEKKLEGEIPFACDHRSAYQGLCKNLILILKNHTVMFLHTILSKTSADRFNCNGAILLLINHSNLVM